MLKLIPPARCQIMTCLNWKPFDDFVTVLKQPVLNSPLVIVENRTIIVQQPHHGREAISLPPDHNLDKACRLVLPPSYPF